MYGMTNILLEFQKFPLIQLALNILYMFGIQRKTYRTRFLSS